MKILLIGDFHSHIHERALEKAFLKLGYKVETFAWHNYFKDIPYGSLNISSSLLQKLYYKSQNKYLWGPSLNALNKALLKKAQESEPDLIFIYRGTHIFAPTLAKLKQDHPQAFIFGYNNDDPFSKAYKKYFWRHYLAGLKYYDHIFYYRLKNRQDYAKQGFSNTSLLRSYYIAERNYQLKNTKKKYDIVFVGHYEPDGRDNYIQQLLAAGISVQIFGTEWSRSPLFKYFQEQMRPIHGIYTAEYNLILNQAKLALVFLSAQNNDTYTRRCFEIPATGTCMLSQYTTDLAKLFRPQKEALYFHTPAELVRLAKKYLADKQGRERIARAGKQRLLKDGHEVSDRAQEIIRVYNKLCQK